MNKMLYTIALGLTLASCTKDEPCKVYDLGKAGELYTPIETRSPSVIYVDGDRIKQEICYE